MTTAEEIAILFGNKERYDTKKLVRTIVCLIYTDLNSEEGYEGEEVKRQIMSETLYLYERALKGGVTAAFIKQRINFLRKNICKMGIQPRSSKSYDDGLKTPEVVSVPKKKIQRRGWTRKTGDRFLRYVCKRKTLLSKQS